MFSVEKGVANKQDSPHLNLYALVGDKFILFTKDHIIPRFYGGPNLLENYDTMCERCNTKKAHRSVNKKSVRRAMKALENAGEEYVPTPELIKALGGSL